VLQCVAVCCSVFMSPMSNYTYMVCCRVLQCVAVRCSVLQCVAVCCSVFMSPSSSYTGIYIHTYTYIHIYICMDVSIQIHLTSVFSANVGGDVAVCCSVFMSVFSANVDEAIQGWIAGIVKMSFM